MLIRKRLWAGEFSNPALRYNSDCDCVQFTPDDGETWIDQPANDPRTSDAYRLPPLTGDDTRCRAAEGMTSLVRAAVDARLTTDGDIQFAGEIIGLAAFIPGFNVLYALVLAFAFFAVTIAKAILEAAFTEPVYDQIRCIFYCNIGEDGQMSQPQFDAAYADLADLDTIARTWVQATFNTFGCVGLSDAGVALEAAADCDECACDHCFTMSFETGDDGSAYGLVIQGGDYITTAWQGANFGSGNISDLYGYWAFPETIYVKKIEMEFYKGNGSGGTNVNNWHELYPTATSYNTVSISTDASNPTNPDARLIKYIEPLGDLAGFGFDINSGDYPTIVQMYRLTITYTGSIPESWSDNCE